MTELLTAAQMRALEKAAIDSGEVTGLELMERAGRGVVEAMLDWRPELATAPHRAVVLCGPGNNGGDGFVAARRLAAAGARVVAALVAADARPSTPDARRNWDRLGREARVERVHAPTARDLSVLGSAAGRYAIVVDALLGTGVQGALRDPIRAAVEVVRRAREAGVPIVAVDTPTAIDLSSGDPSDPAVQADLTVTFHRPKTGLLARRGAAFAGRVLVAPIGVPREADRA
jgi:hydroxyethylthiazole kinase-like uncharacterized protein yjeF